jgi:hypothetical protein
MSYLKGVVPHVASLVSYQVPVEHGSRKMMAIMEALCPMDKAYLTAGLAIVDMLDEASVGLLWTRRSLRNFAVCFGQMLRKTAHPYRAEAWYQQWLQNAPEDKG